MRVLLLTGIFPPDAGGPATYVPAMADALVARGHHVHVVTLSDAPQDDSARAYAVTRIPRGAPRLARMVRTLGILRRLARTSDVIYVNGLGLEAALANIASRKPTAIKVVGDLAWERARAQGRTIAHLDDFQRQRHGGRTALEAALRRWWTRRADRVIVPSAYLAGIVAGWGVQADRIHVVYNALPPLAAPSPEKLLDGRPRIVTVARLVPWKGIVGLLEAVRAIPDASLTVVGDGPERARYEQKAAQLGIASRVAFLGQQPAPRTRALVAAADVFVLNSTYEGLPHVVLEAMRLGVPVIASASGGTVEVVEHGATGLLVRADDHETLAQALRQVAADPSAARERADRAAAALDRFQEQRMVDETEAILVALGRGHEAPPVPFKSN